MSLLALFAVAAVATSPVRPVAADSLVPITVRLQGVVCAEAFQCGQSYREVGYSKATSTASDFRVNDHHVRLVNASGDTERA
ncbi:MAG: hypothetical protein ACK5W7_18110, partial [Gemmatimonadaceae bacterium]